MPSDLRVALRVQANSGNSRREINALNRDLRQAGKDGARTLASESNRASSSLRRVSQAGVASYKAVRQSMREVSQSSTAVRLEVAKTPAELKQMSQAARKAARQTRTDFRSAEQEGVRVLRESVDRTGGSFRRLAFTAGTSLRAIKGISSAVRNEFNRVKGVMSGMNGHLAGAGLGVGAGIALSNNARTQRRMIQLSQTAGMNPAQKDDFWGEVLRVSKNYGNDPDALLSGGEALLAGGLSPKAARTSLDAIGQANALRNADPAVLAGVGMAAKEAYGFDLEQPTVMLDILQKMTIAGDAAKAELGDLGDIFNKVGANASAAGFKFNQSLGLIEALSNVEPNADNLRTMVGNFLTVFNTGSYQKQVTAASGVQFYNKDKSRRDPFAVIADLRRKYDGLTDDASRDKFMNVVFKSMDRDAVNSWRWMLTGDRQNNMVDISAQAANAGPIFSKQLAENTDSASGTAGRMRATLREAMDRMSQPVNKALADVGTYLLDDLKLSGGELLAGGLAAGVGTYYAGRGAKAGAGALLNKFLGGPETLKNVAVGKALEEATGVTSVFVTNWPGNLGGSGLPELPGGKKPSGSGGVVAPWLAPVALGLAATQLGGDSDMSDEGQLRNLSRNKLLSEPQRQYLTAFYQSRMGLAAQVPEGLSYGERENWLSSNATRLAQQQTGLTYNGGSVAGGNAWAAGVANRLTAAALTPPGQSSAPGAAESRLAQLLGKPLVVEIRTDSHMIMAEVERRTDILMRRSGQ